jgi:hypothetical protein
MNNKIESQLLSLSALGIDTNSIPIKFQKLVEEREFISTFGDMTEIGMKLPEDPEMVAELANLFPALKISTSNVKLLDTLREIQQERLSIAMDSSLGNELFCSICCTPSSLLKLFKKKLRQPQTPKNPPCSKTANAAKVWANVGARIDQIKKEAESSSLHCKT